MTAVNDITGNTTKGLTGIPVTGISVLVNDISVLTGDTTKKKADRQVYDL